MTLCKHSNYRAISHILEPRYHDNSILIDTKLADKEHLIIQFVKDAPKEKYGWFYMSGKMVRRHKTQKNGRIEVFVVPLSKRETFTPLKDCNCGQLELMPEY